MVKNTKKEYAKTLACYLLVAGGLIVHESLPNSTQGSLESIRQQNPGIYSRAQEYLAAKKQRKTHGEMLDEIPQREVLSMLSSGSEGLNSRLGGTIKMYNDGLNTERNLSTISGVTRAADKIESTYRVSTVYNAATVLMMVWDLLAGSFRTSQHMYNRTASRINEERLKNEGAK